MSNKPSLTDDRSIPPAHKPEDSTSPVCDHCRKIFATASAVNALISGDGVEYSRGQLSICETAWDGCRLCQALIGHLEEEIEQLDKRGNNPDLIEVPKSTTKRPEPNGSYLLPQQTFHYAFLLNKEHQAIKVTRTRQDRPNRHGYLGISTLRDNPASKHIPQPSIGTKVNSPQIFSWIRDWLAECHSTHHICNESLMGPEKATASPSYFLHISPGMHEERVFLEAGELVRNRLKKTIPYAALSYAWGTDQPHKTTIARLPEYTKGICISSLPRTIREAILVARKLEIDFLWVDSLCIVQDDPAEKTRNLGIMGAIYHDAHLVISAASARTCDDGFLKDRPIPSEYIQIPFGEGGAVNLCRSRSKYGESGLFGTAPLDNRAWAFQEFYMARRLLVFHAHEVLWSCAKTGGDGGATRGGFGAVCSLGDSCRYDRYPEERDWGFIVVHYSNRKLTYENDKFPAISSIAELIAKRMKTSYLAGLWPGAMGQLLSWFAFDYYYKGNRRPGKWRAPSWSYFSIKGSVGFLSIDGTKSRSESRNLGWGLMGHEIKPVSPEAPFGEVAEAKLFLRGRLISVSLGTRLEPDLAGFKLNANMPDAAALPALASCEVAFDAMRPESITCESFVESCYGPLALTEQLWWLLMWGSQESWNNTQSWESTFKFRRERFWGLCLAQLPDGSYHRLGCVIAVGKDNESYFKGFQSIPWQKFTFV